MEEIQPTIGNDHWSVKGLKQDWRPKSSYEIHLPASCHPLPWGPPIRMDHAEIGGIDGKGGACCAYVATGVGKVSKQLMNGGY